MAPSHFLRHTRNRAPPRAVRFSASNNTSKSRTTPALATSDSDGSLANNIAVQYGQLKVVGNARANLSINI
jgi:hypothetical protein